MAHPRPFTQTFFMRRYLELYCYDAVITVFGQHAMKRSTSIPRREPVGFANGSDESIPICHLSELNR